MKSLIILGLTFYSVTSMAQVAGQPFQLEAGKYSYECWGVNVRNLENGTRRLQDYTTGTTTVVKQDSTYIEYTLEQGEDVTSNDVSKKTVTALGDGKFKLNTEWSSTYSYGDVTETSASKFETVVQVEENGMSYNVTVKREGEAEKPGYGELAWKVMPNGRIIVQSYIREKFTDKRQDGRSVDYLVSNQTCIYRKTK